MDRRRPDLPLVTHQASAVEFFHERVASAFANQRVEATEEARVYLVSLLLHFLHAERLRRVGEPGGGDEPLALLLARALSAGLAEQVRLLKGLGDRALYVSGFFSDSLARQVVDIDYYIAMGELAYGRLAGVMKAGRGSASAGLYEELSSRFPAFVEILSEVSEGLALTSNSGLLRLYERWLRTGSRRVADQLAREGIVPTPVPARYVQ
ncbi:MAG TPA: hypothetical protein VNM66_08085 [Thermodesulfobacteriota bacterium]|nr:hypothetical protein [Thermodesulfobacteriota bacterium]